MPLDNDWLMGDPWTRGDRPEKLEELVQEWENYARENGVVLPDYDAPYAAYGDSAR